ncbi:MAG: hypothetical protein GY854_17995 [Deltaproteobacteria bacterium]|nr:hypothetical protein [Deltaproteobacteria bacterium]
MRFSGLYIVFVFLLLMLGGGATAANGRTTYHDSPPVLVVLTVANEGTGVERERLFITKLRLALDGMVIEQVDPGSDDFVSLTLSEKLAQIRPFTEKYGAIATTWIEDSGLNVILLHMVSLGTGRAFVRIVEAKRGPYSEAELALAAEELLGQVYLLNPTHNQKPLERAVAHVIEEATSRKTERRTVRVGRAWSVLPQFESFGGLYGHEQVWLRFGGGLALELLIAELFTVRASVAALAGPFTKTSDGVILGWGMDTGLCLGLSRRAKWLRVGFLVGAYGVRSAVSMALGEGDHFAYDWWDFHGTVGIDLRIVFSETVSLVINPNLGFWAQQKRFFRISDDSTVMATPYIDWNTSLGLQITH